MYWTTITGNHAVMKVPIGGGTPTVLAATTSPYAIAARGGAVYFNDGDTVMMVPAAGGAPVTLATAQQFPFSMAVDATTLYWVNARGAGEIVSMPLAGGTPTTLVPSTGFARIAVDATNLYFTSAGTNEPNDGIVARVPRRRRAHDAGGRASEPRRHRARRRQRVLGGHGIGAAMRLTPK